MENMRTYIATQMDGTETEWIEFANGNGFTCMPKTIYDEMIAAQSTPSGLQVYSTILRDCVKPPYKKKGYTRITSDIITTWQ